MSEGDAPKSFVPNVMPKNDAREQARLQAQIGNMRQQNSQFIVNEVEKKYTLEKKGEIAEPGAVVSGEQQTGPLDLNAVPAVYFSACKKGEYVIEHRTSKILIESCEDCVIEINGKILTACVEIWKCKNVHLKLNTKVKTLQADIMNGLKVAYATPGDMQSIVWQDVDNIDISFADNSHPQLITGHTHMQTVYPDSDMKIDQFIIRFVPELGPGLQPERCVRLKNGFLSTEREAADWDRRNEKARDLFVDKFLKEGGIHLNKDKNATKKIPPNSICACGSKKKYKNCCSNKKVITGLHETQKPKVYVQDKSGVKVETKEKDETSAIAITSTASSTNETKSPSSEVVQSKSRTPSENAPTEPAPANPAEKKSGNSKSAKSTVASKAKGGAKVDGESKPEAKQPEASSQSEAPASNQVTIHTETSAVSPESAPAKAAPKKKKAAKKKLSSTGDAPSED